MAHFTDSICQAISYCNVNSLAPGKFQWNFRYVIFKQIIVIDGLGISCEIALIWLSLDLTDDQSTLVQVMAWCRQATSHYLSQYWPRFLSPYGFTRPQWVNLITTRFFCIHTRPVSWEMLKTSVTQLYLKKGHLQLHPPCLWEPTELNCGWSHYLYHGLHDDVIKWKHFPHYWPFLRGIHRSLVNSPHKGQWRGALMFSLICVWINSWENSRKAGDLRRYGAHYDVIVMNPGFDTEIRYLLSLVTIFVRSLVCMNMMIHTCH